MGNELIEFTRDRLHRERSRCFGYLKLTQTYDVLGRLTQTYQPQIEGIPRYQHYHYDKLHQLIEIQHDKLPHQQFNYDGKGRLTWIKQNGEETRYRFDPAGNREMLPSSANPNQWYEEISLREVRHNRLRQDNDFHYVYDNFSNRIQTLPAPYNNRPIHEGQLPQVKNAAEQIKKYCQ